MRLQQVVQPGGAGSFFKGDLQLTIFDPASDKRIYRS
jgi:hypothetical protein